MHYTYLFIALMRQMDIPSYLYKGLKSDINGRVYLHRMAEGFWTPEHHTQSAILLQTVATMLDTHDCIERP